MKTYKKKIRSLKTESQGVKNPPNTNWKIWETSLLVELESAGAKEDEPTQKA